MSRHENEYIYPDTIVNSSSDGDVSYDQECANRKIVEAFERNLCLVRRILESRLVPIKGAEWIRSLKNKTILLPSAGSGAEPRALMSVLRQEYGTNLEPQRLICVDPILNHLGEPYRLDLKSLYETQGLNALVYQERIEDFFLSRRASGIDIVFGLHTLGNPAVTVLDELVRNPGGIFNETAELLLHMSQPTTQVEPNRYEDFDYIARVKNFFNSEAGRQTQHQIISLDRSQYHESYLVHASRQG